MGHALGIAHSNLASESGLDPAFHDFTNSTAGPDGSYFLNAAGDGIKGSRDDLRGDDINLYWFEKATNSPVAAPPGAVDGTTFSRQLGDLPPGSTFAANSHREVTAALGVPDTEGVLQQGTWADEAQRTLTHEEISALRLAMAGLDEIEGTADDYTFSLVYAGATTAADIVIDFNDAVTPFAVTLNEGGFIAQSSTHMALINWSNWGHIPIFFSPNINWYFNQTSNAPDTANIHVNFGAVSNGDGFVLTPFDNLTDAVAVVEAGGTVHLSPSTSLETFAGGGGISRPLRLENSDPGSGKVRIGG